MKIASLAEVKAGLSAYVKESEAGPVVVTRNGRPVAVLVGVRDDDDLERLLLAHSPRLQAILTAGRQQLAGGEGISHQNFWRESGAGRSTLRKQRANRRRLPKRQASVPK